MKRQTVGIWKCGTKNCRVIVAGGAWTYYLPQLLLLQSVRIARKGNKKHSFNMCSLQQTSIFYNGIFPKFIEHKTKF